MHISAVRRQADRIMANRDAVWTESVRTAFRLLDGFCGAVHCTQKAVDAIHIRPREYGGDETVGNCAPVCLHCKSRARQDPDWATRVGLLVRGLTAGERLSESLRCWFRGKPRLGDAMMLIHKKTGEAVVAEIISFDAWGGPKRLKVAAGDLFDVHDSNYRQGGYWHRTPDHAKWYGRYRNWEDAFGGPEFKMGGPLDRGNA